VRCPAFVTALFAWFVTALFAWFVTALFAWFVTAWVCMVSYRVGLRGVTALFANDETI
jgi:hypothetical protein